MSYDGHVEPGGLAAAMVVDTGAAHVEIRKFSVGPMDNNVYLLRDIDADEALLVDAANDADRILAEIGDTRLVGILTTHGHGDHWQALAEVADATEVPALLHPADADMVPHPVDIPADDGAVLTFGAARVQLLHTPGHTPGSVCVLLQAPGGDHLVTGDTLFPGGPGRTTSSEQFAQIMESVETRLFALGDDTRVYPGHGDDTTLGRERPSIPEWRERGW